MTYWNDVTVPEKDFLVLDKALDTRGFAYMSREEVDYTPGSIVFLQYLVESTDTYKLHKGRYVKVHPHIGDLVSLEAIEPNEVYNYGEN